MAKRLLKFWMSEQARQTILWVIMSTCLINICTFLVLLVKGILLFYYFGMVLDLMKNINMKYVTQLMIYGEFLSCWMNTYITNRKAGNVLMYLFHFICIGLFIFSGMIHSYSIAYNRIMNATLQTTLREYLSLPNTKEKFDNLQQYFECCGVKRPNDWFKEKWIVDPYKEKKWDRQRVPFSCCDPLSPRPCQMTNVYETSENYNPKKDLTIFDKGCLDVFSQQYWAFIFWGLSFPLCVLYGSLFIMLIGLRYVSTSTYEAIKLGYAGLDSYGYLLGVGVYAEDIEQNIPKSVLEKQSKRLGKRAQDKKDLKDWINKWDLVLGYNYHFY
ncbi:hypothetical protein HELRODRAFT_177261 [Helobdella robusta]|uniref:Tetraspanin n=1 Tax=Helobdella robusta TaxID=6412 RepID=T1FBF1_HELRO|nr:hypothetical protein HELRODRAFT_177261 [Helobdella robusta]ESN98033.1 hypothetical protein HELRODRAFT_177261 [Helobdella robusta]